MPYFARMFRFSTLEEDVVDDQDPFKEMKCNYFGLRNVSVKSVKVKSVQNLIRITNSYRHTWTCFGPSITK